MRGRKAALDHVCDKANQDKKGSWKVKEGQTISLIRPTDRDSWNSIMSQRVLLECDTCKAVKYCSLEKINEAHFEGMSYKLPNDFWVKDINVLTSAQATTNGDVPKISKNREEKINKIAEVLTAKSAKMRKQVADGTTPISASPIKVTTMKNE